MLFKTLAVLLFIIFSIPVKSQFTKIEFPDGVQSEGNLYKKDKILYSDALIIKFKNHVFDLANDIKSAKSDEISSDHILLKNKFKYLQKKYGDLDFYKLVPKAVWGDTLRKHKLTGEIVKTHDYSQLFKIKFKTPFQVDSILKLFDNAEIEYVHEPYLIVFYDTPNDPYFISPTQWNLNKIESVAAWDITHGSSTIKIGIVDAGAQQNHEDLAGKIIGGDGVSGIHGTLVASVAGGATNNDKGVASLGWNLSLYTYAYDIKNFNSSTVNNLIAATEDGVDIINMSWGIFRLINEGDMEFFPNCPQPEKWINTEQIPVDDQGIRNAVTDAIAQGIICIAAAGNNMTNKSPDPELCNPWTFPWQSYPAAYPEVIAVTGTRIVNGIERFIDIFNYGNFVDLSAPGWEIWAANLPTEGNPVDYALVNGTSFSSPQVCALAGLIKSISNYGRIQIQSILQNSADKVDSRYPYTNGWNSRLGYGRINAHNALLETLSLLAQENKSINQNATGQNNGRHLAKDGSDYHLIFASGGEIFYRKSINGTSWQAPIRLSTGNGNNNYPSISASSGRIYATWQRNTGGNNYDIYFAESTNSGTSWNTKYVLNSLTLGYDPLPAIQAVSSYVMIVVRNSSGIKSYWSYYTVPSDPTYWVIRTCGFSTSYSQTITGSYQSSTYYFPLAIANSSDNHIYYYYFDPSSSNWTGGPNNLSSIVPGGNSVHITPTISSIPGTSQIHVAWKKLIGSGSSPYDHLIIHRKSTSLTNWPNEWFGTYYQKMEMPSISALASNKIDLLYQDPPGFGSSNIYKMRFNGTNWGGPTTIASNSKYPSVSSGSTTSKYVWTSGTSSPFPIMLSSETLSKEDEINPRDYYSRSIAWLDSSGSFIEIKLHPVYLKMMDGSKKGIDIMPVDLDTVDFNLSNSWDFLSTLEFQIPSDADELVFDYSISCDGIDKILAESKNSLEPIFNLKNNIQVLGSSTKNHLLITGKLQEVRSKLSIPVNKISVGQILKAEIKLNGLNPKLGIFASLGHIFDYSSLINENQNQIQNYVEPASVQEFRIQNYPNPFNPSTQIQYSIIAEGLVTIKIYDILGREIMTLVNEEKPAGIYNIDFDGSNLSSGIYFCRISSGALNQTRKMILAK